MKHTTNSGLKISTGTLCYHIGQLLQTADEDLFDELRDLVLAEYKPSPRGSAKSRTVALIKKIKQDATLDMALNKLFVKVQAEHAS